MATEDNKQQPAIDEKEPESANATSEEAVVEKPELVEESNKSENDLPTGESTNDTEPLTAREKNMQNARRSGVKIDEVPTSELSDDELLKRLTNKNDEYMFKLKKLLAESTLPTDQVNEAISEMLPEMVDGQRKGQTARQLYGPVTLKANDIIHAPEKPKDTKPWMIWMDNSLLFFALFNLMYGVMGLFSKTNSKENVQGGIITLLVISVAGGGIMVFLTKMMNDYRDKENPNRPKMWKIILYSVALFLALMVLISLTVFIKGPLNSTLDPIAYIVIGAVALGAKIYLKRKLKITGTLF